jgi:hypothetical protein
LPGEKIDGRGYNKLALREREPYLAARAQTSRRRYADWPLPV